MYPDIIIQMIVSFLPLIFYFKMLFDLIYANVFIYFKIILIQRRYYTRMMLLQKKCMVKKRFE